MIAKLVLEKYFKEHPDRYESMIAAYVIGFAVTQDELNANSYLKFATGETDTGVIISWNTEGIKNVEENVQTCVMLPNGISINPLNWKRDETYAPASENLGSLVANEKLGRFEIGDVGADAQINLARGTVITNAKQEPMPEGLAAVIPDECPLVLNIIEDCLSKEEQKTIRQVIRDDLAYDFGMVEQEENRQWYMFIGMLIGKIVAGILLWLTETLDEVPREVFFVLFWFAGDRMFEYIFLTGYELRQEKRLAGRLASIKVIFSKTYEEPNYTEQELDKLYTEIAQDTREIP